MFVLKSKFAIASSARFFVDVLALRTGSFPKSTIKLLAVIVEAFGAAVLRRFGCAGFKSQFIGNAPFKTNSPLAGRQQGTSALYP